MALPTYTPELFTDRLDEIRAVKGVVRRLLEGEQFSSRTIILKGSRGFGKSWLAIHLKRVVLSGNPDVLPLFIGLGQHYGHIYRERGENEWYYEDSTSPNPINELIQWLEQALQIPSARDTTVDEAISGITRSLDLAPSLRRSPPFRVLVLILDSVFETSWDILGLLEDKLLSRLADRQNILFVMTGRGRAYPWKSPYLSIPITSVVLSQFQATDDVDYVRVQLEQQLPGETFSDVELERIRAIGGGYPLNNVLVAQALRGLRQWDDLPDELLSFVPDGKPRSSVRNALFALCVLDGFREEQIMPMMAARQTSFARQSVEEQIQSGLEDLAAAREVKNSLVRYGVVQWQNGKYEIDHSIRPVLLHVLQRPEHWAEAQALHLRAQQMYTILAERYQGEYFARQAAYHGERAVGGPEE